MSSHNEDLAYNLWKERKNTLHKLMEDTFSVPHIDFVKELVGIYNRKLEIIEDILEDLAPQLDDSQYEGTTSWDYEDEFTNLTERQAELESLIADVKEKIEHEKLLKDLGMTQDEYDTYLQELSKEKTKNPKRK